MGSGLLVEPYISFYKDCIVGGEQASGDGFSFMSEHWLMGMKMKNG